MPSKKHSSPSVVVTAPPASLPVPQKRLTHWVCAPGNVCKPEENVSFTENFNWRVFRIMAEFIEGYEFLSKLKNEVTIFGSARTMPHTSEYKMAKELGRLLAKGGYTVITGGGPGIMEAANLGAAEAGGVSVGLNIELATEQRINKYVTKGFGFHYFFTRKVMLSASAQAYIFFPGGFGTLDEMSEMLTLIQTQKIPREVPLILVGKAFWEPFLAWMKQSLMLEYGYIDKDDFSIIHIVDSAKEALAIVATTMERAFE